MSEEQIKHFSLEKHAAGPDKSSGHHAAFDYEKAAIEPTSQEATRMATVRFQSPSGVSYESVHTGVNDSDVLNFDEPSESVPSSLSDILEELSSMSYAEEDARNQSNGKHRKKPQASFKAGKTDGSESVIQKFTAWFSAGILNKVLTALTIFLIVFGITVMCIALPGKHTEKPAEVQSETDIDPDEDKEENIINSESKFKEDDKYKDVLLAKTTDAGEDYVKNTLFIGDSNTARINLYGLLGLENVIGIESMGIQNVPAQQCVYFYDRENPVTIPEAVKMMQPMRIVICFGTNNLAAFDADEFIDAYKTAIDSIHEAYSYADIIISAVPPLGSNYSGNKDINLKKVDQFNDALIDFAKDEKLTFLDITEVLADKTGYMKEDYVITDGIHVSKTGFQALGRYFRTHAHITADNRPLPLKSVPKRKPAPAKKVETLNTDKIIDVAMSCFIEDGFSRPGEDTDLNNGTKLTFSIPGDTKVGDEESWGKSLFQSVLARTTVQKGYISISCKEDTEAKEFVFTARIVANQETCAHEFDEGKVVPAEFPCCSGYTVRTCKICGFEDRQQNVAPTAEHVPDEGSLNPATVPTCTDTDQTWVCKICHQKQTTHVSATTGHMVEEWTVSKQPTCTESGVRDGFCTLCGKTVNEVINPNGHSWGEWTETGRENLEDGTICVTQNRVCGSCSANETQSYIIQPESGGGE